MRIDQFLLLRVQNSLLRSAFLVDGSSHPIKRRVVVVVTHSGVSRTAAAAAMGLLLLLLLFLVVVVVARLKWGVRGALLFLA